MAREIQDIIDAVKQGKFESPALSKSLMLCLETLNSELDAGDYGPHPDNEHIYLTLNTLLLDYREPLDEDEMFPKDEVESEDIDPFEDAKSKDEDEDDEDEYEFEDEESDEEIDTDDIFESKDDN